MHFFVSCPLVDIKTCSRYGVCMWPTTSPHPVVSQTLNLFSDTFTFYIILVILVPLKPRLRSWSPHFVLNLRTTTRCTRSDSLRSLGMLCLRLRRRRYLVVRACARLPPGMELPLEPCHALVDGGRHVVGLLGCLRLRTLCECVCLSKGVRLEKGKRSENKQTNKKNKFNTGWAR